MFGRFLHRKPRASLDSVAFDTGRYRTGGDVNGCRTWITPDGDGLGLYLFLEKPDLPQEIDSATNLRELYTSRYSPHQIRIVEVDLPTLDGVRCIWTLVKVPQKPRGLTYLGSITIPFSTFSFVIKMQCQEHGVTGIRETVLCEKAQQDGRVSINSTGEITGNWSPDDKAHDSHFPDHPVSRVRREFTLLRPTLKIDAQLRSEKHFIA